MRVQPRRALQALLLLGAVTAITFATPGAVGAGFAAEPVPPALDLEGIEAPMSQRDGELNVVVVLADPPVAVAAAEQNLTPTQQRQYEDQLEAKQETVSDQAEDVGADEIATVTTALNAVVVQVEASKIDELEALPGVTSVRPVADYELDLSETVPYIGAESVQDDGFDGTGVDVAVIDSGIDYTHQSFGGPGTSTAYTAAYGTATDDPRTTTTDGLFPTAKVVAGFDYVGEEWPSDDLAPDPDPIDCGPAVIPAPCAGGHGSHVSDIILGTGPDKGVAPGAKLFSYKACSAVSTSCSGVALLQAVDAALDPNGNGDIADRVDVINLSLGLSYGQVEDDLSFALVNAVEAGAVVVASAGNSADRPYIAGSPSVAPEVISVAQTQVPSARLFRLVAGGLTVGAVHQPWSADPSAVSGPLVYDTSSTATRLGCSNAAGANPFAPGSHTDQVLLMDRGTCAVSQKVANAASAGAAVAIVANNVSQGPDDLPPTFSFGGPGVPPTAIPGYTVTLVDGAALKAAIPTSASINPATAFPLVGHMVSSSSRGPSYSYNAIKPDIGAPGASVSAEAGTGTDESAFGGTSGAAPMVSGSAALLLDKNANLSVQEVKTLLMNTAETDIRMNPAVNPNPLAPITRIGAGEVRVDDAVASGTAAWETRGNGASLSFGYHAIAETIRIRKSVSVKNYGTARKTYSVRPSFRYSNDAGGAVSINAPTGLVVPAGQTRRFDVVLRIDPSKLPIWDLNGGLRGGDGFRLQGVEYDGYVTLTAGATDTVHLAWQVLPHRSAKVSAENTFDLGDDGTASVDVENDSEVLDGRVEVFSLTGRSDRIRKRFLPRPGENFAIVDLSAVGVRQAGANLQFGIDTFGARAHPNYPAEFDVLVDSNRDGVADYVVFNAENGGFAVTGQNVTAVFNVATGAVGLFFFTDADLNSGNTILTAPMSALGLTPTTRFDFAVEVYDNYFTGALTDFIDTMTYTPGKPRFTGTLPPAIAADGEAQLEIAAVLGGDVASPSQTGFLLLYRDAAQGGRRDVSRTEADVVELESEAGEEDDD